MIAYFSMEIAVDSQIPTYAGGLGVLAGDIVRAAADRGMPFAGVTLLHRKGYFRQHLDASGQQREDSAEWNVQAALEPIAARVTVTISGRPVQVRAWMRSVHGVDGATVPVFFLDTDVTDNTPEDRGLTHFLYGGDAAYRLAQEAILGIGGIRMLRALGYTEIRRFHMNEGHSALLVMELVSERLRSFHRTTATEEDVEAVRQMCVFTTHTPVSAAHDQFAPDLAERIVGLTPMSQLLHRCCYAGSLNLTYLALKFSCYVNGVATRHGEVSRRLFGDYEIDAITNGVHAATWVSPSFGRLFDRHIPHWRRDNFGLRYAVSIPRHDIWDAHVEAKLHLLELVNRSQAPPFEPSALTIGFARRACAYKRANLIFSDLDRLRSIVSRAGPLQLVFAGKAHPHDDDGKRIIAQLFQAREALRNDVAVAYLEEYDMTQAKVLTAGADVWLNTPQPPLEASGTSGMKAALNGVPSLSVPDGWWIEGHVEGVTGWAIGTSHIDPLDQPTDTARDAGALYDTLEQTVLPLFYRRQSEFRDVMRHAIALNGSFFTAQRMLQEYAIKAYRLADAQEPADRVTTFHDTSVTKSPAIAKARIDDSTQPITHTASARAVPE